MRTVKFESFSGRKDSEKAAAFAGQLKPEQVISISEWLLGTTVWYWVE